jgi:outer membrane receptor for monomeric catechols
LGPKLPIDLQNAVPLQVYQYQSNVSRNGLATSSFYVNDTWQIQSHFTLNIGIRFDRHRAFLPGQSPASQQFPANDNLVTFDNWDSR